MNKKMLEGLMNASPEKRYKSFLNTVVDQEEVWLLESDEGCVTIDLDGYIHVLVWPHKEFCEPFMGKNDQPIAIEVHAFIDDCKLLDQNMRFMVFPTQKDCYIISTEGLCHDLLEHLEEIE